MNELVLALLSVAIGLLIGYTGARSGALGSVGDAARWTGVIGGVMGVAYAAVLSGYWFMLLAALAVLVIAVAAAARWVLKHVFEQLGGPGELAAAVEEAAATAGAVSVSTTVLVIAVAALAVLAALGLASLSVFIYNALRAVLLIVAPMVAGGVIGYELSGL